MLQLRNEQRMIDGLVELAARLPEGCVMAEIGSFAGESARVFLESGHVSHLICVDPWENGYSDSDWAASQVHNAERAFDEFAKGRANISKLKMKSIDAAPMFADGCLDFVYIDANHSYESVKQDIELWLPKVKRGGAIGGHDFESSHWPDVARAVREVLGEPDFTFEDFSWLKGVN